MKLLQLTLLLFTLAGALASIYPEGEDEAAWHARIDANIDKNRKSDVTIRVKINPEKLCKKIFACCKQSLKRLLHPPTQDYPFLGADPEESSFCGFDSVLSLFPGPILLKIILFPQQNFLKSLKQLLHPPTHPF